MVETILDNDSVIGIIVRSTFNSDGITFFTDDNSPQQLAYMKHPSGKEIFPHVHNLVKREVYYTSEVLLLKKGIMRVDFYKSSREYLESRLLYKGDVILLSGGGHGFQIIEDVEMIEIKQGPYLGEQDKVKFSSIDGSKIILK